MVKHSIISCAVFISIFTGCATSSKMDGSVRVHDIHIGDQLSITPVELYAAVGDEIRWHNLLQTQVHLGFLGASPIKEVSCEKGFTTWFGGIKDLVPIRAGSYVSVCFKQAGTIRYNVWRDLSDPFRSMSPMAVIYLDETAS